MSTPPTEPVAPASTAPATRADPGFYKRLITNLNPLRQTTLQAGAMSGLGLAALSLDVAATLNLGNPALFHDRREIWKEMSGTLEGNRSDLWRGYFDNVSPYWSGHASEMLQQYVRFNVNGLFGLLTKLSDDMSGTMQGQFKEVLEYDLSVIGLYTASAPIFKTLITMSAHPVGRAALIAQLGIFLTVLGNLLKQFGDIYLTNESSLNALELRLNELLGAFYQTGDPANGARELNLPSSITDPDQVNDLWVPASEN